MTRDDEYRGILDELAQQQAAERDTTADQGDNGGRGHTIGTGIEMTDAELAQIRASWLTYSGSLELPIRQVRMLLSEVDRLREENAALREIARHVDLIGRDATGELVTESRYTTSCPLCHRRITGPTHSESGYPLPELRHDDDCAVMKARALLAGKEGEGG